MVATTDVLVHTGRRIVHKEPDSARCCRAQCSCPRVHCPVPGLSCLRWLRAQILSKTMDSTTLTPDKVELSTLAHNPATGLVRAITL